MPEKPRVKPDIWASEDDQPMPTAQLEGIKPTECASIHHISFYITHHYTIINAFFTHFSSNSEDLRPVKLSMALWCRSEEQSLFLWQSSCQGRCPLTQRVRWGAQWYSHTCYGLLRKQSSCPAWCLRSSYLSDSEWLVQHQKHQVHPIPSWIWWDMLTWIDMIW